MLKEESPSMSNSIIKQRNTPGCMITLKRSWSHSIAHWNDNFQTITQEKQTPIV